MVASRRPLRLFFLLFFALLLLFAEPAAAHPADMYLQTYTVEFSATEITLTYTLSPGPLLAASLWNQADLNVDGVITQEETIAWLQPVFAEWETGLNGQPLAWETVSAAFPTTFTPFELGDEPLTAMLTTPLPPDTPFPIQFSFYNRYGEEISLNWFYLYGSESLPFSRPQQERGRLALTLLAAPAEGEAFTYWDSGTPNLAPGNAGLSVEEGADGGTTAVSPPQSPPTPAPPEDDRPFARLTALVRREEYTFTFLLSALAVSLLLGGMHALTPGHGKALVAAYLIGSRGTLQHAFALGGIVTLTHTGSVLLIGLLTLAASQYLVPTDIFPLLEILSGVLIVLIGLGLLFQRWRGWRGVRRKREREKQAAIAAARKRIAVAAPKPAPEQTAPTGRKRVAIGADIETRTFDAALANPGESGVIRWRALVGLGVSGGLVPCPDAIAILLVAVAINRIALGLSLIFSFSLGLAAILIGIGLALVQGQRWVGRFGRIEPYAPAISLASAVIVLALGIVLTWQAAGGSGYLSGVDFAGVDGEETAVIASAPLSKPRAASLAEREILFMDTDAQGRFQLFKTNGVGDGREQFTDAPFGVRDYALSPDGSTIIYNRIREDRGSDLWLWTAADGHRFLLDCAETGCYRPAFSPDGARVIFEYTQIGVADLYATVTLRQLDLASGATSAVFQDVNLPGLLPDWSDDGEWLSYMVAGSPATIQLYNLRDGRSYSISTLSGQSGVWQPGGSAFLFTEINQETLQSGGQALTQIFRFATEDGTQQLLSPAAGASDGGPIWSPDGEQIAFLRRIEVENGQLERGNQIWLMDGDGGNGRPLTAESEIYHQNVVWGGDGRYLLYQRYDLGTPLAQPVLWILDLTTGTAQELMNPGSEPAWLPDAP